MSGWNRDSSGEALTLWRKGLSEGRVPDWLRSRGVTAIQVNDGRCNQLMVEFQERYPDVWAEDIGAV